MATAIIEEPKDKRSFMVEQHNNEYITVKKMKNNKKYEVDIVVFTQSDLEEFRNIQEEIYLEKDKNKKHLLNRLIACIINWKRE